MSRRRSTGRPARAVGPAAGTSSAPTGIAVPGRTADSRAAWRIPTPDQLPRRTTLRDLVETVSPRDGARLLEAERRRLAGDRLGALRVFGKLARRRRCWPARLHYALLAHLVCEHDIALAELRDVLRRWPGLAEAWYNYGTICQSVGDYCEAEAALALALALDPTSDAARVNLANARLGLGRIADAIAGYREAIQRRPRHAEARWNLSHALLLLDDWLAGWDAYEARWEIPGSVETAQIQIPADARCRPWHGESLRGQHLLVVEEQGYGDTIMCLRYAAPLRALGATTTWAVRPELMRVAAAAVAPDQIVSIHAPLPPTIDYVVSCMSLHQRLGVRPETVPPLRIPVPAAPRPSTTSPPARRIGLAWQGSRAHRNDRIRSLPRGALRPLAAIPGVEWSCLSPEAWEPRLAELGMQPLLAGVSDWYDTATRVATLDLVISVDTAVAHLAASLGVPTWLLISAVPDARWGLRDAHTPWYPTMRLYRQPVAGDWTAVIDRVAHDLLHQEQPIP